MSDTHTLRLGPLTFRTAADSGPTESLGNAIEVVGAALTGADPAPKPFSLSVPVGFSGRAPREEGLVLRRQVRALLDNARARMQGLRFSWTVDPELNGWLIVGGGDLEPADGVASGEWKLTLRDCYVAGRQRTHREAIQVDVLNRRLATTPRDTLGRVYRAADYSNAIQSAAVALPPRVADVTVGDRYQYLTTRSLASADGPITVVESLRDGDVVSFERTEANHGAGDVTLHDTTGSADPADWIGVYGPAQELTPGVVPVLGNAVVRVVWTGERLVMSRWTSSGWYERGAIPLGSLVDVTVVGWTPEAATLALIVRATDGHRLTVCVTLQRGWAGPLVEVYAAGVARLPYVVATVGSTVFKRSSSDGITSLGWYGQSTAATGLGPLNIWEIDHGDASDAFAATLELAVRLDPNEDDDGLQHCQIEFSGPDYAGVRFSLGGEASSATVFQDDFSADSLSRYLVSGTVTISGGTIRGGGTLLPITATGFEEDVAIKAIDPSGARYRYHSVVLRRNGPSAINVYFQVASGTSPALVIQLVSNNVTVAVDRLPADPVTTTVRWLHARIFGDQISASLWNSDPRLGGAPELLLTHTLTAAEQALFPPGTGRPGFTVDGGWGGLGDDFWTARYAGDGFALARSTLSDVRANPTLVARN